MLADPHYDRGRGPITGAVAASVQHRLIAIGAADARVQPFDYGYQLGVILKKTPASDWSSAGRFNASEALQTKIDAWAKGLINADLR